MKKQKSRESRNPSVPVTNCPAVSVVIPLYNAEKYIGECLDSILAQTFQNFEVIVVDDCSTDSSCLIVENYAEKFGGRLTLSHMKKNSGGAGLPRNKGIKLARGKYIYFLDPDDTITLTALEELYTLAQEYDADVVHCEKWYKIPDKFWNDEKFRETLKPISYPAGERIFITQPTFLTNNLPKRITDFGKCQLAWSACNQLIRRKFIIEYEIEFGDFSYSEDMIFTMCEICCAKKYLVVPNVIYHYRGREGSATNNKFDVERILHQRIRSLEKGISQLDNFLNGIDFYSRRPDLKYILFDMFFRQLTKRLLNELYSKIPVYSLDNISRKEFFGGDNTALMSFIFNTMNVQRLQLMQTQQQFVKFNQFAHQAQARIAQLEAELKRLQSQPQ